MKLRAFLFLVANFWLLVTSINLTSCKKDDEVEPAPVSTSFTPEKGFEGATVNIVGEHFSTNPQKNIVTFNGVASTVTVSTATTLTVSVPVGGTTGKISVGTPQGQATSANDFTVLFPSSITSFSPASGGAGAAVTITGTNFSATAAENTVKFNGLTATVTAATTTSLVATVPSGASTGKISVLVNGVTSLSPTDFTFVLPPTLSLFTPVTGPAGTTVTITGTNFNITPENNIVKFNNVEATVTASTATQIKVTVPAGASTGKISVTIANVTGTSVVDFTFLPTPTITSIVPLWGPIGTSVTITGSNFSAVAANNIVKFNGVTASVAIVGTTQLIATVPDGATTGKITIGLNGVVTTSTADFQVGCADVTVTRVTITSISGNTFQFNYELKNIGTVPMDLSRMFLQCYVSSDAAYGGGDLGAGGFGDYGTSEPLLEPNTVRLKSASVQAASINITTHPYLIVHILSSATPATVECSTSNNESIKKIEL